MPNYTRSFYPGGTFFFTIVTFKRQDILTKPLARKILHTSWLRIRKKYPFKLEAICLLPNHFHCIVTLPEDDGDYAIRWRGIKGLFSKYFSQHKNTSYLISKSRIKRRETNVW